MDQRAEVPSGDEEGAVAVAEADGVELDRRARPLGMASAVSLVADSWLRGRV